VRCSPALADRDDSDDRDDRDAGAGDGDSGGALRRVLGPLDATAVVVGAIVGVGIFFTPGRVAGLAGDLALPVWALGGVIAMLGALTFAELGGMYPRTGAQYAAIRDAYGPAVGFVYVVCNATAIQAGAIAIIAIIAVQNGATAVLGRDLSPLAATIAAVALTAAIAAANIRDVRVGARLQTLTAAARLLALIAVVLVGAAFTGEPPPAPPVVVASPFVAVATGLVPVLFAFGGWQQALWIGGEIKDPIRNVPRAIVGGVGLVAVIYLGANWAYLHLLGVGGVASSQALAADAVAVVLPGLAARVVAAAVAVSAVGALGCQILTGPRLIYALAHDRRFFAIFGRVHAGLGTPVPAIVLLCATAMALLLAAGAGGVDRLLTGVVLVDSTFFALTALSTLVLLRRHPRAAREIRMPGFPVVPVAFVLAELGVIVGAWMQPEVRSAAVLGLAWIVAAFVLYRLRFRERRA
jgi:APA family basic amino acid/polyamine antiporter